LVEGTFDREEASVAHVAEEYAMQHALAVGLRLLIRVEDLECRVSGDHLVSCGTWVLGLSLLARFSSSGRQWIALDSKYPSGRGGGD
jgi:hypothetical protein